MGAYDGWIVHSSASRAARRALTFAPGIAFLRLASFSSFAPGVFLSGRSERKRVWFPATFRFEDLEPQSADRRVGLPARSPKHRREGFASLSFSFRGIEWNAYLEIRQASFDDVHTW